jgi:putative transposase
MNLVAFLEESKSYICFKHSRSNTIKTYKFRIYPNMDQAQTLNHTIEACRLLYNESLEQRRKDKGLSYYDQKKRLTQIRKTVNDSLKHIHSQVLQNVILRLERTFQNYHRDRKVGQPRFKRRDRYNSITYPQYGAFSIKENKLRLSFIDGLIKIKMHKIPIGTIKTCTIIRDINRWFACITTTNEIKNNHTNKDDSVVGVDVGLTNWMTLSNGQVIDRPRFMAKSIEKIKRLQRILSRKKKGSKNRNKARIHLAKAWRKVRLQRQDYCHKVTTDLTKRYRTLIFEKLSIKNMVKNHNLATSILDATWYKIKQLAAYKAEVYQEVPARNTTQMCSNCGCLPDVKKELNNRIHDCLYCGLKLDRDHNAAINVLNQGLGLGQTFVERKPLLVSNIEASKLLSMKQEAHDLSHG